MQFYQLRFQAYYHRYFVVEADDLTEQAADLMEVYPEDCYALCSTHIRENGMLGIQVLAIGPAWDNCRRGLRRKAMLALFEPYEIMGREVRLVEPNEMMVKKNAAWLEENEPAVEEDLQETRCEGRLDDIRHSFFPDIVKVGFQSDRTIREYNMKLLTINGPFAEGRLMGVYHNPDGLQNNEYVRALPYALGEQYRLLAVFTGEELDEEDREAMRKLMKAGFENGLGFCTAHQKH